MATAVRRDLPDNEIPAPTGIQADLVDTGELLIWMDEIWSYSTGFTLRMHALAKAVLPTDRVLFDAYTEGSDPLGFLCVVTFANGKSGTNYRDYRRPPSDPERPFIQPQNGQRFFVSPLPPPGPLTIITAHPTLGVGETVTVIDGAAIADAAQRIRPVW